MNPDLRELLTLTSIDRPANGAARGPLAMPCSLPPPGSPRYEAVLRMLVERELAGSQTPPNAAPPPVRVTPDPPDPPAADLAPYIDHTLLRPTATTACLDKLCREAVAGRFAAVCVNPHFVAEAAAVLAGTGVKVCSVAGFPLGASSPKVKAFEAERAAAEGADEIDVVINLGRLLAKDFRRVHDDLAGVVKSVPGRAVKVILETGALTDPLKVAACVLAREAGAAFVKTSTGFGPGGATIEDVRLMRETVGPAMGVKAAGGIRDAAQAWAFIRAGATRIGASRSMELIGKG